MALDWIVELMRKDYSFSVIHSVIMSSKNMNIFKE